MTKHPRDPAESPRDRAHLTCVLVLAASEHYSPRAAGQRTTRGVARRTGGPCLQFNCSAARVSPPRARARNKTESERPRERNSSLIIDALVNAVSLPRVYVPRRKNDQQPAFPPSRFVPRHRAPRPIKSRKPNEKPELPREHLLILFLSRSAGSRRAREGKPVARRAMPGTHLHHFQSQGRSSTLDVPERARARTPQSYL